TVAGMSRGRIGTVLEMIKFEHSVFALPFALTGALLAARAARHEWPTLRQILWIVVAMVAARSAAMTTNRIVDLRYDRENPRTKLRALVTGALSLEFAWFFNILAVVIFFVAAWQLNPLALKLAPLAIAILFFDSEAIRNRESAPDRARNARRRDCAFELPGAELWIAVAGVGRDCSGRGVAHVRAFAGQGERFEQAGRCVFQGERLY